LGANKTSCIGNLKYAAPPLPADATELDRLSYAIGNRPVWIAASTHPGEDASVARVHKQVVKEIPDLLTLIAPRHAVRGDEIEQAIRLEGLPLSRRSRGELPDKSTEIYLCDTMGEMGLFYRVAPVVVMGKSWIGEGGQNPLEPARLGCAVLFGPHMENFNIMAERMLVAGAAFQFADENHLAQTVIHFLKNPALCTKMADAGSCFAVAEAGSAKRTLLALKPYLQDLSSSGLGD